MSGPIAEKIGARLGALVPEGNERRRRACNLSAMMIAMSLEIVDVMNGVRRSTDRQTAAELYAFAAAAEALERAALNVSFDGVMALGGSVRTMPNGLLLAIRDTTGRELSEWAADTRAVADAHANRPATRGRKKNQKAARLAGELAIAYRNITGRHPTISVEPTTGQHGGQFLELVRDVFAIVGLPSSAVVRASDQAVKNLTAK